MRRAFTGWHMAAILVAGFGIVVAVNMLMATLAVGGFSGVVVENSYVASQQYNGWLDEARRQEALGWSADAERLGNGGILVTARSIPAGAKVSAMLRRPLGRPDTRHLDFIETEPGRFISTEQIGSGRWIIRLKIVAANREWTRERSLP